tara:strand:- start:368 stop:547 length:180 start_codon:yes stop_codon:yes gene_type:complete
MSINLLSISMIFSGTSPSITVVISSKLFLLIANNAPVVLFSLNSQFAFSGGVLVISSQL